MPWRLIVDAPADGAWNMAVDEAMLEAYASGGHDVAPTLRIYGWNPPALSLGRFQDAVTSHDPAFLRAEAIDLVRRPTGGSAVLHEHERTYAVVGRLRHSAFQGSVLETYSSIAGALCAGLRTLGLDARSDCGVGAASTSRREISCFGTTSNHEISVGGMKLVGSAQLRRRGAFLQHGSILIRSDARRLGRALGADGVPSPFGDLATAIGRVPDFEEIDRKLIAGFAGSFSVELEPGRLTSTEAERATRLRSLKYLAAGWTLEAREPR